MNYTSIVVFSICVLPGSLIFALRLIRLTRNSKPEWYVAHQELGDTTPMTYRSACNYAKSFGGTVKRIK